MRALSPVTLPANPGASDAVRRSYVDAVGRGPNVARLRRSKTSMLEAAGQLPNATAPVGDKDILVAESWDGPGVITKLWVAADDPGGADTTGAWGEQGARVLIYTDDDVTPAVNCTVGEFFGYYPLCAAYDGQVIGRAIRDGGRTGGWRDTYIPFTHWMAVYLRNNTTREPAVYARASYNLTDTAEPVLRRYAIGRTAGNFPVQAPIEVDCGAGAAVLESILLHVESANDDAAVREGNWIIYDGDVEVWSSSGGEDAVNGAYYEVPRTGYPAGEAGRSLLEDDDPPNTGFCFRLFFPEGLRADTRLKVKTWLGHPGQGTLVSTHVDATLNVGYWSLDADQFVTYVQPGADIRTDSLLGYSGTIPATAWVQPGDKVQATGSASGVTFPYAADATGQDARMTLADYLLPTDFWAQVTVRMVGTQAAQEVFLGALGATPDTYFGSAVHVMLVKASATDWVVGARDEWTWIVRRNIGHGADLTNVDIDFALKVRGTRVSSYWRWANQPDWSTIASWTTGKTDRGLSLGVWPANARFTNLQVKSLATETYG